MMLPLVSSVPTLRRNFPAAAALWMCLLLSEALIHAQDPDAAPEKHVRHGRSMSAGEADFVSRRKDVILQALRSLNIDCAEDSIPNVAVLGSGGGQRAAVAMAGSVLQLRNDSVLDTVLYLGGISGSTWTMASLYSDKAWSSTVDDGLSVLIGPGVDSDAIHAWVRNRSREEDFSLTDIWAAFTAAAVMKRMDTRHLSEDVTRNATNPYPVYCAIEKSCFHSGPAEGKWFEVTPHEAGFPELGVFINTAMLGSKFLKGDLVERIPEMDMLRLQGYLGSALADEETNKEYIPDWLSVPDSGDESSQGYGRMYRNLNRLVTLLKGTTQEEVDLTELNKLDVLLSDNSHHEQYNSSAVEDKKGFFQTWTDNLKTKVDSWSQSLQRTQNRYSFIANYIVPLVNKWEWGTTNNFLYNYTDPSVPSCLNSHENIHLIDAGLMVNIPYPSFLGSRRDVDLMIALEFSAGEMFETLTLARDYATSVNESFPEVPEDVLKEKDWPKDFYVFEGSEGAPSIIYMPLFNQRNCKDAEEVKAKMQEFSTFQCPYSEEQVNELLEIAKANVRRNRDNLLRELKKTVESRQNRKKKSW